MKSTRMLLETDDGEINEAENIVLSDIDYSNRKEVAATALFYQYLSEKEEEFLVQNNYSKEEVLDGLNQLMKEAGYGDLKQELGE